MSDDHIASSAVSALRRGLARGRATSCSVALRRALARGARGGNRGSRCPARGRSGRRLVSLPTPFAEVSQAAEQAAVRPLWARPRRSPSSADRLHLPAQLGPRVASGRSDSTGERQPPVARPCVDWRGLRAGRRRQVHRGGRYTLHNVARGPGASTSGEHRVEFGHPALCRLPGG